VPKSKRVGLRDGTASGSLDHRLEIEDLEEPLEAHMATLVDIEFESCVSDRTVGQYSVKATTVPPPTHVQHFDATEAVGEGRGERRVSVSEMKKKRWYVAWRIRYHGLVRAVIEVLDLSWGDRTVDHHRTATLKPRSYHVHLGVEFHARWKSVRACAHTSRGTRNTGSRHSATRVICQSAEHRSRMIVTSTTLPRRWRRSVKPVARQ